MGCSMKLFTVLSLLVLVSMSLDMGGPVRVNAIVSCDFMDLCVKYCDLVAPGEPACCPAPNGPCRCGGPCPRLDRRPLVVDVKSEVCDRTLCAEACKPLFGCCAGYPGRCTCRDNPACPFIVNVEIADNKDIPFKELVA